MDYAALAQKNGGNVATATKPGAIDYAALAKQNGAVTTPQTPATPQVPAQKPGYLTDPNNGSGILPYSAINDALKPTDVGQETSPGATIADTIGNQAKSVAKLGVGVAQFFDPVSIGKTVGSVIGGAANYGTESEQQKESQKAAKDYIPELQAAIQKNKAEGKDTSHLETALKIAGGIPLPDVTPATDIVKGTPAAAAKLIIPPFIQKAVTDAKQAKVSDLAAYVPGLQDPKNQGSHLELGARILEGIHSAIQSIAQDPQQLTPYALALKSPIEKYAPKLDSTISKVGSTPGDLLKTGADAIKDNVIKPIMSDAQTRAVSDLTNKYRKIFTQFKAPTKAYNKSLAIGKDPAAFGAENGYVVDVQKGKIVAQPTIDKVTEEYVKPRNELVGQMLNAYDKTVPEWERFKLDDLATEAKQNIRQNPLLKGSGNLSASDTSIDKIVTELKKQYGDKVTYSDLHDIKNSQWDQSHSFDLSKPKFEGDVNYALGRAAKDAIEVNVKSAPIKKLNAETGDAQDFIKNLQKVNTQSSPGGAGMTKMFGRTIGTIIGSHAGPFVGIAGALAGDYITGLLQDNSVAGPIKRAALESIKPDSALYDQAQTALEKLKNMPAAQEPGITTKQTIQPADLSQEPLNQNKPIKVNQFDKAYPKYITPDQIKSFTDLLKAKDQAGKPMDISIKPGGGIFKNNLDTQPAPGYENTPFSQIKDHTQALLDESNQGLAKDGNVPAYSDWSQTAKQTYTQFKKIFNAWKDNPEDFAQLAKTDAGQKLRQQIYDVAKELDINENEVFDLFQNRILLESKKASLGKKGK